MLGRRAWPIYRRGKGPAAARQALWQLQLSCERVDATRTDHTAHHSLVGGGVQHDRPIPLCAIDRTQTHPRVVVAQDETVREKSSGIYASV